MSFRWNIPPEQYLPALTKNYAEALEADILRLADSLTDQIADWMRAEARWQDRTGNARAALYADVLHVARQSVTILVSHGPAIDYSVYLETSRFGVISDTVDNFGPLVFNRMRELIAKRSGQ